MRTFSGAAIGILLGLLTVSGGADAFELAGTVKDSAGQPVAEAQVWRWQDHEVLRVQSDALGTFRFADAGRGHVQVVAYKDGYAFGGAEVPLLGRRDVAIVLAKPVTMALRVLNASFKPVAGATLRALSINDAFVAVVPDLAEHGFPNLRSDESGVLSIPAVPEGAHLGLVVMHPRYAETRLAYLPVKDKEHPVKLNPGIPIRGRITDPTGKPVERARVSVLRSSTTGYREHAERLTDREGYFSAPVAPGEYQVAARHPQFASPRVRRVTVRSDDVEAIADLSLAEPRYLTGKVVGPKDEPGAGVRVRYLVDDYLYEEVACFDDGSFELRVPPGEGALRVLPPPGYTTENFGDVLVKLEEAPRADTGAIRLIQLAAAEGAVNGPDGQPQKGVLVSSRNLEPATWAITDEQGRFRIRVNSMPEDGKARFRAEHSQRFERKDFEVDIKQPKPATVALEPFEPDLSQPPPLSGGNDLSALLYQDAPEPEADTWFNSEAFKLKDKRGKVVVLTLWGGFDTLGPSRDRMFELTALHALYRDDPDILFFGVHDNGSEPYEIEQYLKGYGIEFPVARDVEAFTTFARYSTRVIPQTLLIDKSGKVRFYQVDGRLLELIKSLRREG